MAERERLEQALRNASQAADAGDQQAAADAKRLANALKQMRGQSQQPQRGGLDAFARGIGSGIAGVAGIVPGAAMEAGNLLGVTDFEDTSGANLIRRGLAPIGLANPPGEDPAGTIPGAIGEGIGQFGLPGVGATAALARRGASLATDTARTPAQSILGRIGEDVAEQAARRPVAGGASEVTAAGGAALGRELAEEDAGEGSWQAVTGELVGGVIGGLTPVSAVESTPRALSKLMDVSPISRSMKDSLGRFFKLPPAESTRRAVRQRVQQVAGEDVESIQQGLRGLDESVDPSLLTPAQRSGDPGLMSLAARERADDPHRLALWRDQAEQNLSTLRQQLGQVPESQWAQQSDQELQDMVVAAGANARRRLESMTPNQRRSEASLVMRQELGEAMRTARGTERDLWQQVPQDMVMPAENARTRYNELLAELGPVTQDDMPSIARRFMDPDSAETFLPRPQGDAQDVVPLKNLQELRSGLLDEAARARASGDANRARLSSRLAEGLLEDMENVAPQESPGTAAFTAARNFSRQLNDRFTRGVVGDALATNWRRESRIPAEEMLDRTLGRGGIRSERANRAFVRALESPSEGARGAFNDFLNDDFLRTATRTGPNGEVEFLPGGGERFMRKYKDLFDAVPRLRDRYQEAIDSGNVAGVAQRIQDGVAGVLAKGNPASEVRRIKNMAKSDDTGAVWEGFRRNLISELNNRATTTREGQVGFSGSQLLRQLDDPRLGPALKEAFNKTEMARLRRIANTASRIEQDMAARPVGSLTNANVPLLNQVIARVGGARAGAAVDRALGSGSAGTSLQSAQLGANILGRLAARGVRDPQARLISDALKSPELLDALLVPPQSERARRSAQTVVNAWLAGVIDEQDALELNLDWSPDAARRANETAKERETRLQPAAGLPQGPGLQVPDVPVRRGQGQPPTSLQELLGQ